MIRTGTSFILDPSPRAPAPAASLSSYLRKNAFAGIIYQVFANGCRINTPEVAQGLPLHACDIPCVNPEQKFRH
jgi:hypothetical protein